MVELFGVFGAEMAMSFRSFGVGPKVGNSGQFRIAQVGFGGCLRVVLFA